MKNQSAFTLLEVVLALSILVFSVSIFSSLQFRAFTQIWRGKEDIDRVFLIKKELCEILLKVPAKQKAIARMKDKPIKTVIEDPTLTINSQLLEIDKKSDLKRFIKSVDIIRTEGEWDSGTKKRKITMMSFELKPSQKSV
jgi:hypothetical protein